MISYLSAFFFRYNCYMIKLIIIASSVNSLFLLFLFATAVRMKVVVVGVTLIRDRTRRSIKVTGRHSPRLQAEECKRAGQERGDQDRLLLKGEQRSGTNI